MQIVNKLSADYIRLIVQLSEKQSFFDFIKDEQFNTFCQYLFKYNLLNEMFPNDLEIINNIIYEMKLYKDKYTFLKYCKYDFVKNNFLEHIQFLCDIIWLNWTDSDFEFLKNSKYKNMFIKVNKRLILIF